MTVSDHPLTPIAPSSSSRVPLLELMPADVRRLVEASFTPVSFGFGEVIVAEGDRADAMFVIQSGTAQVVKSGEHGREMPLNVLCSGDMFGERSLLDPEPQRTATVRASSPVQALRLDRGKLQALIHTEPEVGRYVQLDVRRRELRDFLRRYPAFGDLPPDGMRKLLGGLVRSAVSTGELVIRQGEPTGPMYIVRHGRLRAHTDDDGTREPRTDLGPGDAFGEVSLLRGTARIASVEAITDCELWALEPDLYAQLAAEFPRFGEGFEQRVAAYDYRRSAHVPPDFAEELLPADAAGPDVLSEEQARAAATADPSWAAGDIEIDQFDDFVRHRKRIRRFPLILQNDSTEAGATSLAMICRYYGRKVSLAHVREVVHTSVDGTSLSGISQGAEALGFKVSAAKVSEDRLDSMPLPAMMHLTNNHWVVLVHIDARHAWVVDPARGRRRLERAELEANWSGYAALIAPTEALMEVPEQHSPLSWYVQFFKPYRRTLLVALALAFLSAAGSMLIPVLSKVIVDKVIHLHDIGLLSGLVLTMFGALFLSVVVTIVQRLLISRIAVRVDRASLNTLSQVLLALPMAYFRSRRIGDIGRRLSGLQLVREISINRAVACISAITQVVVAVAVMCAFSWRLTLVYLLSALPLYGILMWYAQARLLPSYEGLEECWGKYQSRQIDSIRGIETVKAMGAEESLRRTMLSEFDDLSDKIYRADVVLMLYNGAVQLISFLSLALFLWLGALQVLHQHLTVGGLISFNALVLLSNQPLVTVVLSWDMLQQMVVLLGRLNDVLERTPEQGADHSALAPVKYISGHIQFQDLSFQYPGPAQTTVLDAIDFEVRPGSRVGIVGRSGSGKTTLVKCLCGLLEPTGGTILYDDQELTSLDLRDLRRHIGVVLQENHMFDATIAENIAFGTEQPDPERVVWAARAANAAEFVERLPLGYQTRIGESGLLLSGGQRQRIAIARAVYHRPPVLVFDEATSALDTESERAVKQNLDQLLQGRTSFVIAHRLSTVRDADVILVLEKGRLVERGTHDELMARQGLYYYLCSQQLGM
jgi:ABC-type bacteriocin/lantibiotic exporter with double-glycine peptidase domain/CRP-like cAMP-binding protein